MPFPSICRHCDKPSFEFSDSCVDLGNGTVAVASCDPFADDPSDSYGEDAFLAFDLGNRYRSVNPTFSDASALTPSAKNVLKGFISVPLGCYEHGGIVLGVYVGPFSGYARPCGFGHVRTDDRDVAVSVVRSMCKDMTAYLNGETYRVDILDKDDGETVDGSCGFLSVEDAIASARVAGTPAAPASPVRPSL